MKHKWHWKLPWRQLAPLGLSLLVIKTALASWVSWVLAAWLFHAARPYFAPLAAILSLQVTVADSVHRGLQRILGVVAGIIIAFLAVKLIGVHGWSIGLVVLIGMAVATRLRLGAQGIPQVAISALLVMTVGAHSHHYAIERMFDTVIGALIAIMINAIVVPPDYTPRAQDSIKVLASALSDVLRGIEKDLIGGLEPGEANRHLSAARHVDAALHDARSAIRQAEQSLKWNYLLRHRKSRLKSLREALTVLDHAVSQVRGIARTLFVTLNRDVSRPFGQIPQTLAIIVAENLTMMAQALVGYAHLIDQESPQAVYALEELLDKARALRRRLIITLIDHKDTTAPKLIDMAAVVSDMEKMSEDLQVSARYLVPLVVP